MVDLLKRLRAAGGAASQLANVLTILGANWGLVLSAATALGVWLWKDAYKFVADPNVRLVGSVFLWTLWSYIALSILYRLHKGIKTLPYVDYAFGLIIEAIAMNVDQDASGNIQPYIRFRNTVNAPIKLKIVDVRTVLDGKTNPDPLPPTILIVPRLANKAFTVGLFKKSTIKGRVEGMLDITFEYGPYDAEPVRRLRIKNKLTVVPPAKGVVAWGFLSEHISEDDTPI